MKVELIRPRLLVDDFQKCFDFYTEMLGFKVTWGTRNGPFASFSNHTDDGNPVFAMFLKANMTEYTHYKAPVGTGHKDSVVLCIPCEDVDIEYERLKALGVEFMGEPMTIERWYMRCVYLRDPEGNIIELSG